MVAMASALDSAAARASRYLAMTSDDDKRQQSTMTSDDDKGRVGSECMLHFSFALTCASRAPGAPPASTPGRAAAPRLRQNKACERRRNQKNDMVR